MITHVLVDETPLDVHSFVIRQLLLHFRELSQGLVEVERATEHEALMEHR